MAARKRKQTQGQRSQAEAAEIEDLERRIAEGAPPSANSQALPEKGAESSIALARKFSELPLSQYTQDALVEAKYKSLTAIQRFALPQALCGRDVLGAAKTGSGKTLAFLIPLIEKLYRLRWGLLDGLGALVISPTRELALQIFDELRKVGKGHDFSAGVLIGGKDVKEEQSRVGGMNILVCTPGRLLHHMDESPGFDASSVQILVLDEADRILDMGFSAAVTAIVENLPVKRQTLLFSATQTKSVKQLARLSLKDPEYVSVHENSEAPTPAKLEQGYAMCALQDKTSILWSFIRSHVKAKILVFVSTGKQVKFLYEAFKKLRPGCPVRSLYGSMKQMKRMTVFYDFAEARTGMVLFATDLAARGLDFTKLDWVFQMDCPEDVPAYIHRVGRTARYVSAGRGLLLLLPSEKACLEQLAAAKVPIKSIKINPSKTQPLQPSLQALLSKIPDLKAAAQASATAYLKSVFLAPNKAVFDIKQLPLDEYAFSLGLSAPPKLRFIKRTGKRTEEFSTGAGSSLDGAAVPQTSEGVERTADETVAQAAHLFGTDDDLEDNDLLTVRKQDVVGAGCKDVEANGEDSPAKTSKKKKRLKIRPDAASGNRIVFDDGGAALDPLAAFATTDAGEDRDGEGEGHLTAAQRFKAAAAALKARDVEDKRDYRERRRTKLGELKAKKWADGKETGPIATLGPGLGYPGEEAPRMSGGKEDAGDGTPDDWNSEEEGELMAAMMGRTKKQKRRSANDADTEAEKRMKLEKAHFGMEPKQSLQDMTLAEQEALALKLLSKKGYTV